MTRCGGKEIVIFAVSITQPRTFLMVDQVPSPARSFLMLMGSRRHDGSEGESGRKILSMECSKVLRTWVCEVG